MRTLWLLPLVLILILTGCNGGDEPEDPAPTDTLPPSRTPLPPTWTGTPPGFAASPTATLTVIPAETGASTSGDGAVSGQPVLPPTWTPGYRSSVTPRYTPLPQGSVLDPWGTPIIPTAVPYAATWTPLPEFCNELQRLTADETIVLGQPALVTWQPITGVTDYEVAVWYSSGDRIYSQRVIGTSFEFPAEIFTAAGIYQYEITPLDANGQKMCYSISWELFVSLQ